MSLLDDWRRAEAHLGDPEAVAAAALPPRLQVLLAAMEHLDAGDAGAVEAFAASLPEEHRDVQALLRLLLAAPGTTPLQAHDDVPETLELPFRDLLASLDVARTGKPGPTTPRLDLHAGYRPLLHAVYRLFTDDRTDTYANPLVRAVSPRADQVQLAARAVQITGHVAARQLADHHGGDLSLTLRRDRWPSIDDDPEQGDLGVWARRRAPWTIAHDDAVSAVLDQDAPARRAALGTLLHRLARDLPLGRTSGLAGAVRAAWSLAWSLDPASDLVQQLSLLQLRVDRFDPESPATSPLLVVHLWRQRHHAPLSDDDRLHAARALLGEGRSEAPEDDLAAALHLALATTPDDEEAGELLLEHATRASPGVLDEDLVSHGATPDRRRHLLGLHAAANGFHRQALQAVRVMASRGAPAAALGQILRTVLAALSRREDVPEALQEPLATTWDALTEARVSLELWGPLLLSQPLRTTWPDGLVERLGPQAADLSEDASAADHAAALLVAHHLPDRAARRPLVRALGRRLRALPPDDAADLALAVLAWTFAWHGGQARTLTEGVLRPVVAFLLRDGAEPLDGAGERLPPTGPVVAGAVDAYLFLRPGGEVSLPWRERLGSLLAVPPTVRDAFRAVVREASLDEARGLGEAAAALQSALQARLDVESAP